MDIVKEYSDLAKYYNYRNSNEVIQGLIPDCNSEHSSLLDKIITKIQNNPTLKLESIYLLIVGIETLEKSKIKIGKEVKLIAKSEKEIEFLQQLHKILNKDVIKDVDIQIVVSKYHEQLFDYTEVDFLKFYTGVFKDINDEIENLQKISSQKFKFIEKVNFVELGNYFKFLYLKKQIQLEKAVADEIRNMELILSYIKRPNGVLSAPAIANQIKMLKEEYISEDDLDYYDMTEEKLLKLRMETLKLTTTSSFDNEFQTLLRDCFKFRSKSKKGIASFLYGLFSKVLEDLPSYEEWKASKEQTIEQDDLKAWALFKFRAINKIINIDSVLS